MRPGHPDPLAAGRPLRAGKQPDDQQQQQQQRSVPAAVTRGPRPPKAAHRRKLSTVEEEAQPPKPQRSSSFHSATSKPAVLSSSQDSERPHSTATSTRAESRPPMAPNTFTFNRAEARGPPSRAALPTPSLPAAAGCGARPAATAAAAPMPAACQQLPTVATAGPSLQQASGAAGPPAPTVILFPSLDTAPLKGSPNLPQAQGAAGTSGSWQLRSTAGCTAAHAPMPSALEGLRDVDRDLAVLQDVTPAPLGRNVAKWELRRSGCVVEDTPPPLARGATNFSLFSGLGESVASEGPAGGLSQAGGWQGGALHRIPSAGSPLKAGGRGRLEGGSTGLAAASAGAAAVGPSTAAAGRALAGPNGAAAAARMQAAPVDASGASIPEPPFKAWTVQRLLRQLDSEAASLAASDPSTFVGDQWHRGGGCSSSQWPADRSELGASPSRVQGAGRGLGRALTRQQLLSSYGSWERSSWDSASCGGESFAPLRDGLLGPPGHAAQAAPASAWQYYTLQRQYQEELQSRSRWKGMVKKAAGWVWGRWQWLHQS